MVLRFSHVQRDGQRLDNPASATFSVAELFRQGGPELLSVGRAPNSSWQLNSIAFPLLISRQHAFLGRLGDRLTIYDNSSLNGTYVNGQKLTSLVPRALNSGDVVTFGGPTVVHTDERGECTSTTDTPFMFRLEPASSSQSGRIRPLLLDLTADDDEVQTLSPSSQGRKRMRPSQAAAEEVTGPPAKSPAKAQAQAAASEGQGGVVDKLENDLECVICRDWMVAAHSFAPCGHTFCGLCLANWLQSKNTCPCCREKASGAPHRALLVDNIIASMIQPTLPPDEVKRREETNKKWQQQAEAVTAQWKRSMTKQFPHAHLPPADLPGFAITPDLAPMMRAFGLTFPPQSGYPAYLPDARRQPAPRSNVQQHRQAPRPQRPALCVEQTPRQDQMNTRVRCQDCNACFGAASARVRSTEGNGMRWLHLQCLPAHKWAGVSTTSIQGFNNIVPAEQARIRALVR
ncbi:hypothetical protein WJX73_010271 [Symbiochloris irregularis]|uniref:E3 ubiquitin-protein ligase CHFR n=1 Tax=Symbiochloris irregularis TaxID=706552 RepID=A0AAW1PHU3_9CHLO